MSAEAGPNVKKRPRVQDDVDEDLDEFGKKVPPPAPIVLPGGYQDKANPFNDAQLSAPFQWKLRDQKLSKAGVQTAKTAEEEAAQRESTMVRVLCKSFALLPSALQVSTFSDLVCSVLVGISERD